MRKRIVIGVIGAVGVGVLVFVLSQPRKGSLEWHKKEYVEAHEFGMFAKLLVRYGPDRIEEAHWRRRQERIDYHLQALIDAGYVGQRAFIVSNRSPRDVAKTLGRTRFDVFTNLDNPLAIPLITKRTSNSVTVVALPSEMHKWDALIREADVPESGK